MIKTVETDPITVALPKRGNARPWTLEHVERGFNRQCEVGRARVIGMLMER